jgi:acylglycerol lipase
VPGVPGLFERTWPLADAKGAVVIVHGVGEHSGRYDYVAQKLNAAGYAAYAQDARGHGQSAHLPITEVDPEQPIEDVVEFCARVHEQNPHLFLLAHSMGTLFALPAATKMPSDMLSGLVLSGVAVEPGPGAVDLLTHGAVPVETLSRDEQVQKDYADDPLVWDTVPAEVMLHGANLGQLAKDAIPLIEIPVLLIHGTEDRLCSYDGANYIYSALVITDKTVNGYEGLRHEILNEPEKDKVISDVVAWLDKH